MFTSKIEIFFMQSHNNVGFPLLSVIGNSRYRIPTSKKPLVRIVLSDVKGASQNGFRPDFYI